VAFHVEISHGFSRRAQAFNLDESTLRRDVLDPWTEGRVIRLGDRDWKPKDSKLRILEGPELSDVDIAMGRGWSNAGRVSENVTRRLIEASTRPVRGPVVAVLAESEVVSAELIGMLARLELETTTWPELRARILGLPTDPRGPGYAAVLSVEASPSPGWLFDAGLARGALGSRAVFAQLGDAGIPAQLAGIEVIRLDPQNEASLGALHHRLVN
jgi:hypothetical protein